MIAGLAGRYNERAARASGASSRVPGVKSCLQVLVRTGGFMGPQTEVDDRIWLGKEEAAALAGVKVRQLERRAAEGIVQKKTLPRAPNEKAARVLYAKTDVMALKGRVAGSTLALQRSPVVPPGALVASNDTAGATGASFWAALTSRLAPPVVKPWLTLAQAAEFSGLPAAWLKRGAEDGSLEVLNVGTPKQKRWRFSRDGLAHAAG